MRSCLAAVAAALAVTAAGCGGTTSSPPTTQKPTQHGGTLKLATAHDVTGLDQFTVQDNESIRAIAQITEGLYKTDAHGQIRPWLATKDDISANGLVHTLTLRPGVVFSDGAPLTAADVKFTLDQSRKNDNFGFLMTDVKSVAAPAKGTVVIRLAKPSAALHAALALFINGIVPAHFGAGGEKAFAEHPIGTGPFVVGRWDKGSRLVLRRNPRYWQKGKPVLDEVDLIGVPDDTSRVSQLRGGQVDVAVSPPWPQIAGLKGASGLAVGIYAPSQLYAVALNTKAAPFTDARIRQAVSLAADRPSMVKASLAGNGRPATSFLAPSVPFAAGPPAEGPNVAAARRLVQEAGAPKAPIELILRSGDSVSNTVAQILQQDLKAVGLTVKLVPLDQAAALDKYGKGDYTMTITGLTSDILDPTELVSYYVAAQGFTTGVDTKALAPLAAEAAAEADHAKRAELYRRLQLEVHDQYAFVPLEVAPWVYAMSDAVKGFAVNGTGIPDLATVGKG